MSSCGLQCLTIVGERGSGCVLEIGNEEIELDGIEMEEKIALI